MKTLDPQEFFSYIAGGNTNWYSHFGKLFGIFNICFEHFDPGIPLLEKYPAEVCPPNLIQKFQSNIIHNISELETTKISINIRTDKLWYIHTTV